MAMLIIQFVRLVLIIIELILRILEPDDGPNDSHKY